MSNDKIPQRYRWAFDDYDEHKDGDKCRKKLGDMSEEQFHQEYQEAKAHYYNRLFKKYGDKPEVISNIVKVQQALDTLLTVFPTIMFVGMSKRESNGRGGLKAASDDLPQLVFMGADDYAATKFMDELDEEMEKDGEANIANMNGFLGYFQSVALSLLSKMAKSADVPTYQLLLSLLAYEMYCGVHEGKDYHDEWKENKAMKALLMEVLFYISPDDFRAACEGDRGDSK